MTSIRKAKKQWKKEQAGLKRSTKQSILDKAKNMSVRDWSDLRMRLAFSHGSIPPQAAQSVKVFERWLRDGSVGLNAFLTDNMFYVE